MENKNIILIAGGTGFIGKKLADKLVNNGEIRILTRKSENLSVGFFNWNPYKGFIDEKALEGVTHIINLTGEGIADKRWTSSRKKIIEDSRTIPAKFIFSKIDKLTHLKQYITASGINCYDVNNENKSYTESDEIASDFVSQVVKKWEASADLFQDKCAVLKIRIPFVISENGGAVKKLEAPIKMGFGAAIGKGNQAIPWVHLDDLVSIFEFGITENLAGKYHANSGNTTNKEITELLAKKWNKKLWLPNIPAFVMKLILGDLSVLILKGIHASNQKIINSGFKFKFKKISDCF